MSDYSMTPQAAMGKADDMDTQSKNMSSQISTMTGELDKAAAGWTGASKDFYDAAKQRWLQQSDVMASDLGQAANTLRTIAENIQDNEKRVAGMYQ